MTYPHVAALAPLLVLSGAAWAGDLHLHVASAHTKTECAGGSCNERNLGIGYRGDGKVAPTVGAYRNTYYDNSFYGGVNVELYEHLSVTLSAVTGYRGHDGVDSDVMPLITAHIDPAPRRAASPVLTIGAGKSGAVLLLSIRISVGKGRH